ncbi:DUF4407 domain-containing protein [Actinokineospora auranticolor]|uniref:Uncharacterized protein DUF4407 n=1 Tax=Actinokineospora auranticolor TaxID=155976 RepID=A0A2S6GEW0_9PSEU|nr:DUF4407 domain-containing protein [Actinokineospora auranticolor]PPK63777.1 uncharacterized protein DUF4407 [Actinokineospora auranticolor]
MHRFGRTDRASSSDEIGNIPHQRDLRRSAHLFGVVTSVVVTASVVFGNRISPIWLVLVLIGCSAMIVLANRLVVDGLDHTDGPPAMPMPRRLLSVVLGAVVAYSVLFWVFGSRVDAVRYDPAPDRWGVEQHRLDVEQAEQEEISRTPETAPEMDPEVLRLRKQLDDTAAAERKATETALCEFDGTCGTRHKGDGDAYRMRVADRDELTRKVAAITAQLDQAKAAARSRADNLAQAKKSARSRLAAIDRERRELGPRPANPTTWWSAVIAVGSRYWGGVSAVSVGALLGYLAVDWWAFLCHLRRICKGE